MEWIGVTRAASLKEGFARRRHAVSDAAKRYDWQLLLGLLDESPQLVNATRLDGRSLFTPLHQAAHGGAPVDVVQQLVERGAWRTLRNAEGAHPLAVAKQRGHAHLFVALAPKLEHFVAADELRALQAQLHRVIMQVAGKFVQDQALRLPELDVFLELAQPELWFPVPGMYGGFSIKLVAVAPEAKLLVESWCRVTEGSGRRHAITASGAELVAEGFV